MSYPQVEEEDLINKIRDSEHILTVVGAGLSKPSGIPTFREDRQFWQRSIEELATKSAFERDPGGVWTLYERLRMCAVQSLPNAAHHALACLARAKPRMLIVCQNIEDLLQRAQVAESQIAAIHGSMSRTKCTNESCTLDIPNTGQFQWLAQTTQEQRDRYIASGNLSCQLCKIGMYRPNVCWFGETLPSQPRLKVENWLAERPNVDLVLVIGTERFPYVAEAEAMGAEVAYFNFFEENLADTGGAWYVSGDVAQTLPRIVHASLQ